MHAAHTLRFAVGHLGETRCRALALGESEHTARVGAFRSWLACLVRSPKDRGQAPPPHSVFLDVFFFSLDFRVVSFSRPEASMLGFFTVSKPEASILGLQGFQA